MRSARSAVAVAVAALVIAACGGGGSKRVAVPTTVAGGSPSSTSVPTSGTPTTTVAAVADGTGAFLTAPVAPTVKPAPSGTGCDGLVDSGFSGYCQTLTAPPGTLAYLVEQPRSSNGPGEVRALVWRRQGSEFSLALRWVDQVDTRLDALPALRRVDLAQDGDPKVVAVLYDPGSGGSSNSATVRAVDVVEATGSVTLHRSLDHGVARQATGGGLETWSRLGGSGSDRFRHEVIRFKAGAWRVDVSEDVAAETVPRKKDDTTF